MLAIRYLPYQEVNKQKWDACIQNASNGGIYASSTYLDHVSGQWDALVMDDYKAVMPLTWKKKWGVYYLYQPYLSANGGIFSTEPVTAEGGALFLEHIPKKFRYWDFNLNQANNFTVPGYQLYQRKNYILPLNLSYEELSSQYRVNLKRNIRKAIQLGCIYEEGIPVSTVINLAKSYLPPSGMTDDHYERFSRLYNVLQTEEKATTAAVYNAQGVVMASCVFFFSHGRAYYILVGNHPDGKSLGASHLLLDQFIQLRCQTNLVLDFEGSDTRSLAFFYESYGATLEPYVAIRRNCLPALLKWLKR